jgi:hypothetical protein
VVDAETDEMRIEVGRRLEGIVTDGLVGWMIRGNARTFASANATWLRLHSTLLLLHYRLREAALGREFSLARLAEEHDPTRLVVGGAVTASLRGDTGYFVRAADRELRERLVPRPTPELLTARHAERLARPTFVPEVDIVTEDSQEYLASFEATAAHRDYWRYMEAGQPHRIVVRDDRALVIHTEDPLVHPKFLWRTKRGWQIDEAASLINVQQLAGDAWSWSLRETNDAYHHPRPLRGARPLPADRAPRRRRQPALRDPRQHPLSAPSGGATAPPPPASSPAPRPPRSLPSASASAAGSS